MLVVLMSLFKYLFSAWCRNVICLYVGFVKYNLTVEHCHILVISNLLTVFDI
jgi:hypothetical protein